jgi:hypothetical protein
LKAHVVEFRDLIPGIPVEGIDPVAQHVSIGIIGDAEAVQFVNWFSLTQFCRIRSSYL